MQKTTENREGKLKPTIDYRELLRTVFTCDKDVYYLTDDGDTLNLKSELSKFVFTFLFSKNDFQPAGRVRCASREDLEKLRPFLAQEAKGAV